MMLGRLETGTEAGDGEARPAAAIPVSGEDVGPASAPAYSAFAPQMVRRSPQVGQAVRASIAADGAVSEPATVPAQVRVAYYDELSGHNSPDVFWTFMNAGGTVLEGGQLRNATLFDWVYTLGLPLTEPLWTQASIGGQRRAVMVQLFERRVLTYTPSNDPAWQIEMANVVQQPAKRHEGRAHPHPVSRLRAGEPRPHPPGARAGELCQ
jgi:hypothetical protein